MEAVRTSETSVNNHFTQQYNPEDSSEHELLLLKLNFYEILNIAGQWFKSYLHDRKQQAEINTPDSNKSI
jgi:hypothetical protein